jgi:hypothetical protein
LLSPDKSDHSRSRYLDLRGKALHLLERFGFIVFLTFQGIEGRFGRYAMIICDSPSFPDLLALIKAEEERRKPGAKVQAEVSNATTRLVQLAESFHRVVLRLRDRRAGREPVIVKDEYDAQYIFAALLDTRFEDVRPEEWTPSYAGSASRVDFLLKNESVLFETKMTRDGLTDRKLGEELIIDIARYKQREIKALVCFVYDPEHRLKNPSAMENDLSKPTDGLDVRVLIRPKS